MVEDKIDIPEALGKGLLYSIEKEIKTKKRKKYTSATMEDYKRFCEENGLEE